MIIVAGCSWSDPNWICKSDVTYDTNFPKWFDQLNTNKEVKSIAKSGSGNPYMFELIVKEIINNPKITHVVWALSDWLRFSVFGSRINPQLSFAYKAQQDEKYDGPKLWDDQVMHTLYQNRICDATNIIDDQIITHAVQTNITMIHAISEMCNNKNIRFTVFQALRPATINKHFDFKFYENLYNNEMFTELENTSVELIGFPWIREVGGMDMDYYLKKNEPFFRAWRVSKVDAHPNEIGHKEIAGWVNENITFD